MRKREGWGSQKASCGAERMRENEGSTEKTTARSIELSQGKKRGEEQAHLLGETAPAVAGFAQGAVALSKLPERALASGQVVHQIVQQRKECLLWGLHCEKGRRGSL